MRKRSREKQSTIELSPSIKKQKPNVKLLPSEPKSISELFPATNEIKIDDDQN